MLSTSRKYLPRLRACDTRDIFPPGKNHVILLTAPKRQSEGLSVGKDEHANILRGCEAFSHTASDNIFLSKGWFDSAF
jgi:hypothetical protein